MSDWKILENRHIPESMKAQEEVDLDISETKMKHVMKKPHESETTGDDVSKNACTILTILQNSGAYQVRNRTPR